MASSSEEARRPAQTERDEFAVKMTLNPNKDERVGVEEKITEIETLKLECSLKVSVDANIGHKERLHLLNVPVQRDIKLKDGEKIKCKHSSQNLWLLRKKGMW